MQFFAVGRLTRTPKLGYWRWLSEWPKAKAFWGRSPMVFASGLRPKERALGHQKISFAWLPPFLSSTCWCSGFCFVFIGAVLAFTLRCKISYGAYISPKILPPLRRISTKCVRTYAKLNFKKTQCKCAYCGWYSLLTKFFTQPTAIQLPKDGALPYAAALSSCL